MIKLKIVLLCAVAMHAGYALAAEEDTRGERGLRLELKKNQATTQKREITTTLPPAEQVLPKGLGVWAQPSFRVNEIRLAGNTVLAESEVAEFTREYVGKTVRNREIQALRELLSTAYQEKGYVNSGVVIPDQDLAGGVLRLQAIEGSLTEIIIDETDRLNADYVASRIEGRLSSPLNINELQEAIQLLQQDEHIDQLAAELVPGTEPGEANLRVAVKERDRWHMGVVVDNHRAESIGAEQANLLLGHNNVTGRGDQVNLSVGASEGNDNISLDYAMPIFDNDAAIHIYYSASDASVLEEPFDDLDVKSETSTFGVALSWPLLKDLSQELVVTAAIEAKESTTELLGRKFSLSPGAINGESEETVLSLSVDWTRRSESQVIALRSTIRNGVDLGDVTLFEDNQFGPIQEVDSGSMAANPGTPEFNRNNRVGVVEADGEFVTWVNQLQYIRKLSDSARFNFRALSQTAFDPLLSAEKLAIGGVNTVRGYRENFLVRDNGFSISLELPFDFPIGESSTIQFMPFVDYGESWDEDDTDTTSRLRNTDEENNIASAGIGLSYRHNSGFSANLTWATDISDNFDDGQDPSDQVTDEGLQDDGIHFSLGYIRRF